LLASFRFAGSADIARAARQPHILRMKGGIEMAKKTVKKVAKKAAKKR
jgi:hypothetical protein